MATIAPNAAYAPGMAVKVLSPMVMRQAEDLSSAELRHLGEGDICIVKAIGMGETGRRLQVASKSDGCEGWISCTSSSGKQLIAESTQASIAQPPLPPPASMPPPSLPPASGMGVSMPPPASSPLMGIPEQEPRLNECFEVGQDVRAIDKMILREAEDLNSADICELGVGTECTIRARGPGPSGRRLLVMVCETGQVGWISCFSQSGKRLVDAAEQGMLDTVIPTAMSRRPNEAYPIGSHIISSDPARMRADEELRSMEIMELPAGTELVVIAHGVGEDGRRIQVCTERTSTRGWISCCSASGKALVRLVEPDVLAPLKGCQVAMPSIPQAPPGVARDSGSGFDMPPGYENGTWHYICVDPTGVRLREVAEYAKKNKTGQELVYGEMVTVNFRGREDKITWLLMADGRGFAMERTNRRRMSEVNYQPVLPDHRTFLVRPQLKTSIPLALTPIVPSAASSKALQQVIPGMVVQMRRSATVILQVANDKFKEIPSAFIEVFDPAGHVGWIPERTSTGEEVLVEPDGRELLPPPLNWITVLSTGNAKTTHCPGSPIASWERLQPGQFLEVCEALTVGKQRYFKLAADDLWICETPVEEKGRPVVELVTVEQHWWAYVCDDKTGAAIRDTPTRVKTTKTGQVLKHRQRVVSTDIAIMKNGEEYIHLGPPFAGWVPTTKVDGRMKMQALNPVPASKGAWAGGKYPIQKRPPLNKDRQPKVWNAYAKGKQPGQAVKSQTQPAPASQPIYNVVYGGDGRCSQNEGDFNHPLPLRRSFGQQGRASVGFGALGSTGYPGPAMDGMVTYHGITAVQLGNAVQMVPGNPQASSNFWPARQ